MESALPPHVMTRQSLCFVTTSKARADPPNLHTPQRRQSQAPPQYRIKRSWRGKHQPSEPLAKDEPCPIKWTGKLQQVTRECRAAYEARAPWRPMFDMSSAQFAARLNNQFGTSHSTETWKKRFCAANRAVYLAVGLWWEGHSIGLHHWVGKPYGLRLRGQETARARKPFYGETFFLKIHEPMSKNDNGPKLDDGSKLEDDSEFDDDYQLDRDSQLDDDCHADGICQLGKSPQLDKNFQLDNDPKLDDVSKLDVNSAPEHFVCRRVAKEAMMKTAPNIRRWLTDDEDTLTVKAPKNIVDAYTSMYTPYRRTKLPAGCIYRLAEDEDGSLFWLEVPFHCSMEDLFGMYSLASTFGDDDVRDIIIDQWLKIYIEGRNLRTAYMSRTKPWGDVPAEPVHSILDFEPEHINLLWHTTELDDPARKFWLDIIESMGDTGFGQVNRFLCEYTTGFRMEWMQRLSSEQLVAVSDVDHNIEPEDLPDLAIELDRPKTNSPVPDHAELPDSRGVNRERSVPVKTREELQKDVERIKRDTSTIVSAGDWHPDITTEVDNRTRFIANLLEDISLNPEPAPEVVKTHADPLNTNPRPHNITSLDTGRPSFCHQYHNHHLRGIHSCYHRRVRGDHDDDPAIYHDDFNHRPPPNHVSMTINGICGFIIQNHTDLTEPEFLDLPCIYPEWKWDAIRSVNAFTPSNTVGSRPDILVNILADPSPYPRYHPVYFQPEIQPQDDQGRWPSHPGYMQGDQWVQDWDDHEDREQEAHARDHSSNYIRGWRPYFDPRFVDHRKKVRITGSSCSGSDPYRIEIVD